ncbi:MAG: thioredoxin [Alphaproteobacteria bacterium]|jgi:putative thioredoxin|nr:thioredoxin [Alphaproteobacteria bacterium]MDP6237689.1 thioredoxin [Alphaproteobacteria bacterium]MDP7172676.1 thioredoxin [Alphaproteobacteria bacterium]MDP7233807.1 thioredoxin [Alphaproteobacteria bacterium]HJN21690.1 thioredoxin [Alphaproteobacteria bacterium]|tara:strand:- start:8594 stop:9505 length:912 start_codon:yes stop_codon:yes gene_type:complete
MEMMIGGNEAPADAIKDSDTAGFAADVIEASREVPVVVDFWAGWCEPCKTLGPALEKAVQAAGGAVKLVKIDVDANQQLAQQLRVQSLPTVLAFSNGQPVDGFVGAVPPSQIKSLIQRLTGDTGPSEVELALEQAEQLLAAGDAEGAGNLYSQALAAESDNPKAAAGLARALLATGDAAAAREVLDGLEPELARSSEVEGARAAIELAEQSENAIDDSETEALRAKVAANENDHQARFDLAAALFVAGDREGAIDILLEIVSRDRAWNDEAARKQLVKYFDAFGQTDPLTIDGRRRLSSILFS